MPLRFRQAIHVAMPLFFLALLWGIAVAATQEADFMAENDAAMARMMTDMTVTPTGDVDRDFVAMMAPHHQGAIEMAQSELRYGHNEQLRRIAQEIIVAQLQELVAMRLAVGETPPPSRAASTTPTPVPAVSPHGTMPMPAMSTK